MIDWTNAAAGDESVDVAVTYALLTCPNMPGPPLVQWLMEPVRRGIGRSFARRYRGRAFDERVAFAADLKAFDSNMAPDEVAELPSGSPAESRAWSPPGPTARTPAVGTATLCSPWFGGAVPLPFGFHGIQGCKGGAKPGDRPAVE